MADKLALNILSKGVDTWNQWRVDNPEVTLKLCCAHLHGANLFNPNLSVAKIIKDLEAVLEQFRLSAEDLGEKETA